MKFTLGFECFVFVTLCPFSASGRRMNKSTKQTNSNLPTFTVGKIELVLNCKTGRDFSGTD